MRIIAVVLILLTGARLALGEYYYRDTTHDLVIRAYRDHAIAGCSSSARLLGHGIDAVAWRLAQDVRLEIGRRDAEVYLWETTHKLWSQRYRDPYLHLAARTGGDAVACQYDILRGLASIKRN